jgi:acetolactate synthase-1/2/3 large subunit
LIRKSQRPLLLVGGGVHLSQGYAALQRFAESESIPVAHSMSGKGGIACTHALSVGVFGRYSRIANDFVAAADLLIAVGCKLGEIATKRYQLIPATTPLIHLDIVPEEFGRTTRADVALCGDLRAGLDALSDRLSEGAERAPIERNTKPRSTYEWHAGKARRPIVCIRAKCRSISGASWPS